ncbi:hypothetical protein [Myceligenerans salitolerans]|uniref:SH3b domain-containing protein n=1 Tax=Myceligenerans salitolerans TaxID=1230528 RepID=A0ABS3IAI5_9MICO|nr:hypothetical protein [Myceligenerans salitolerans]MBO0610041.1 hypothetical protein [Myceligenerans salitolerans]
MSLPTDQKPTRSAFSVMRSTLARTTAVAAVAAVAVGTAVSATPASALAPDTDRTATARISSAEDGSGAPTYRVFATREGLVGHTTANGHRIKKNDHFVALPSRLALSGKGEGARSVRVCAPATGRCEYAPVWDVGPWNIDDNYWDPASRRARFADLPRGVPEAQAAYYDGYNGGKDGFGREVRNPAGIDLADGTFYDGLGLTGNAWVDVTFLWLGDGPTGTIRTGTRWPLNVRSGPGTSYAPSGLAAAGTRVTIRCTVWGEWVDGHLGSTPLWNKIGPGHFVSDAYTRTGTGRPVAPPC